MLDIRVSSIMHFIKTWDVLYVRKVVVYVSRQLRKLEWITRHMMWSYPFWSMEILYSWT